MSSYGFHENFPEPGLQDSNIQDDEPVTDFPEVIVMDGQAVPLTAEEGAEPPKKKVKEVIHLGLNFKLHTSTRTNNNLCGRICAHIFSLLYSTSQEFDIFLFTSLVPISDSGHH